MSNTSDKNDKKPIGRVSSTNLSPSTTYSFCFWTDKNEKLDIFDVIKVEHGGVVNEKQAYTYGIITNMSNISDAPDHITNYVSSDFGQKFDNTGITRLTFNLVEARVLSNNADLNTPVSNGEKVLKCELAEIQKVLFNVDDNNKSNFIPFGYLTMYGETNIGCYLPKDRVLGPEAVHVNLSGVSGRAAKTTTAMCILSAIQRMKDNGAAFILFNVKGEDLMYLDQKITETEINNLSEKQKKGREAYQQCFGFQNLFKKEKSGEEISVQFYEPTPNDNGGTNDKNKHKYYAQYNKDNIDLLFSDIPDDYGTTESVIQKVQGENLLLWEEIDNFLEEKSISQSPKEYVPQGDTIFASTYKKCLRILRTARTENSILIDSQNQNDKSSLEQILQNLTAGSIKVIDVHKLNHFEQAYVIGSITRKVRDIMTGKLQLENKPENVIIFADELNQFAPKGTATKSAICQMLIDIAARGRTDGIILFTAEQFLSKVEDQVVDNCSVKIYGHTNAGEMSNFKYNHIPESIKNIIYTLENGSCILDSPDLVTPLKVHFPYPSYALKKHKSENNINQTYVNDMTFNANKLPEREDDDPVTVELSTEPMPLENDQSIYWEEPDESTEE